MAGSSASLPWLEKTRLEIQNLQEWKEFTEKLYDAVLQQMNENNIRFFNDLSQSEKIFVLEKAAKALHSGATYNKLTGHISSCLEQNIYSYVTQEQEDGSIPRSQSDLVVSHIQDGLVSILEKRPSLKVKLHILFNQPIPTALRALAWKLQLSNTKARMEYLTQASMNKARSILEREIALYYDDLLSHEQTLQHLKDNKNMGRCMRNVMSYYHKRSKANLSKEDCLLLVPLVQVVSASSNPSTSLESMTTQLVEQYIAFMDTRPTVMRQNQKKEDGTNDNEAFQSIASSLEKIDPNLAHTIQNVYKSEAEDPEYALIVAVKNILQPVLQVFFVGYLNMNTLLYVWDQYILGLDEPSYNCLPALGLTFLLLLQSHLIRCSSPSEIEAAVKMGGPALSIQEFQMVINKHVYQELYNVLNKGENHQIPVHDPTQASSWTYISKATAPLRTKPQDRRKAREEREFLRRQAAEKEQIEEQIRRQHEEEQRRKEEERLNKLLEDARRRFEEETSDLQNQLKQEQQQNYELEKRATKQINDLQSEIRRLLQQRRMSFGGHSIESVMAPPPSVSSQTPPQRLTATPSSPGLGPGTRHAIKEVNGKTANTVVLDLLKHMVESADMLINGWTVAEKDTLNGITRKHQKNYKEDIKNAEIELFGRELESNELDYIEEPKRTAISKRLSQAIKRRTDARYMAAVKNGGQNLPRNVTYTDGI